MNKNNESNLINPDKTVVETSVSIRTQSRNTWEYTSDVGRFLSRTFWKYDNSVDGPGAPIQAPMFLDQASEIH